jgi:hypothetical protein
MKKADVDQNFIEKSVSSEKKNKLRNKDSFVD